MREVHLPRSLDELWDILSEAPDAAILAGGTDLLVKIRGGAESPSSLVCLERLNELREIRDQGDSIFLGACATHAMLLGDRLVQRHFPVLVRALRVLGSPQIRNMGTIGGNLVTASPAGDTLPPLYALGAEVCVMSKGKSRRPPIREFIGGPGKVDLAEGEIVTGVILPKEPVFHIHHYEKVGLRNALAIAVVSLAALVRFKENGEVEEARFAWGSAGPTVVTSPEAEAAVKGSRLEREAIEEAAHLVSRAVKPISDIRATAEYRRIVAGNLLFRLLEHTGKDM